MSSTSQLTAVEIAERIDALLVAGATAWDGEIAELCRAYQQTPVLGL